MLFRSNAAHCILRTTFYVEPFVVLRKFIGRGERPCLGGRGSRRAVWFAAAGKVMLPESSLSVPLNGWGQTPRARPEFLVTCCRSGEIGHLSPLDAGQVVDRSGTGEHSGAQ